MPLIWTSMSMALVVKAGGLTTLHLLPQLIMMKVITMTMMVIHTLHANHPPHRPHHHHHHHHHQAATWNSPPSPSSEENSTKPELPTWVYLIHLASFFKIGFQETAFDHDHDHHDHDHHDQLAHPSSSGSWPEGTRWSSGTLARPHRVQRVLSMMMMMVISHDDDDGDDGDNDDDGGDNDDDDKPWWWWWWKYLTRNAWTAVHWHVKKLRRGTLRLPRLVHIWSVLLSWW